MRMWTLHPSLLDRVGLVAAWREALLAQKVLCGLTRGYTNHPQLDRFKNHPDPIGAVGAYLESLLREAQVRGYNFDETKIHSRPSGLTPIVVTRGQVAYERALLVNKLRQRSVQTLELPPWQEFPTPIHPLFSLVDGDVEDWEKVQEEILDLSRIAK